MTELDDFIWSQIRLFLTKDGTRIQPLAQSTVQELTSYMHVGVTVLHFYYVLQLVVQLVTFC